MDSLSQLALGAAIGVAVMGRRTAVWKAALWGGIAGTLPDLDAFIDHGDAVRNMTLHRAWTHALFWLTLAAPVLACDRQRGCTASARMFRRWWLALWLALVTHPLLDTMTVYGTQLAAPLHRPSLRPGQHLHHRPALHRAAAGGAGRRASPGAAHAGLAWNRWGLILSTGYLAWSATRASLRARACAGHARRAWRAGRAAARDADRLQHRAVAGGRHAPRTATRRATTRSWMAAARYGSSVFRTDRARRAFAAGRLGRAAHGLVHARHLQDA